MDFALAMPPWKIIWGLHILKPEKIGLSIAMSFGILLDMPKLSFSLRMSDKSLIASASFPLLKVYTSWSLPTMISIVRLPLIYEHTCAKQHDIDDGKDMVIWSATEPTSAIIAASIPVLRVFIKEKTTSVGQESRRLYKKSPNDAEEVTEFVKLTETVKTITAGTAKERGQSTAWVTSRGMMRATKVY
jgi:hypothetical protein